MKFAGLLLLILTSIGLAPAQTSDNTSDLIIISVNVKADERMAGPAIITTESKSALSVQEPPKTDARAIQPVEPPHVPKVAGYTYQAIVKNIGTKEIKSVTWTYAFFDSVDRNLLARHNFKNMVKIRPGAEGKLEGFNIAPPTKIVSAKSISKNPDKPFIEKAFIFRIEYTDGSVWQRPSK